MNWESGVSGCKLLHLEWINKVILYSVEDYIQSLEIRIKNKEKQHSKESVYVYN